MKFVILEDTFDCPYCPVEDGSCPYYNFNNGRCMMDAMEGCSPYEECDAFYDLEEEEEENGK